MASKEPKQKHIKKPLSEDSEPSSGDYKKIDKKTIKTKKGSLSVGISGKPSKIEKEILDLITEKFLTIKQIATLRKCSKRNVYKIVKNLRKKGLINSIGQSAISEGTVNHLEKKNQEAGNDKVHSKVHKGDGTCEPFVKKSKKNHYQKIVNHHRRRHSELNEIKLSGDSEPSSVESKAHPIRLHGQQFNIGIILKDDRYRDQIGKTITIDGNTIRCHKSVIDVYSWKSFIGADPREATEKSLLYWNQFFVRLENDLKIILIKPRAQNIKQVKAHYSELDNELSEDADRKDYKIKIFTTDDKKLWFTIDNSFNFHEAETLHPQDAEKDMQDIIQPFFNDLRDNKPPTLSKLMEVMGAILKTMRKEAAINTETAAGLNTVVKLIETQTIQDPQAKPGAKKKEKEEDDVMYG